MDRNRFKTHQAYQQAVAAGDVERAGRIKNILRSQNKNDPRVDPEWVRYVDSL